MKRRKPNHQGGQHTISREGGNRRSISQNQSSSSRKHFITLPRPPQITWGEAIGEQHPCSFSDNEIVPLHVGRKATHADCVDYCYGQKSPQSSKSESSKHTFLLDVTEATPCLEVFFQSFPKMLLLTSLFLFIYFFIPWQTQQVVCTFIYFREWSGK